MGLFDALLEVALAPVKVVATAVLVPVAVVAEVLDGQDLPDAVGEGVVEVVTAPIKAVEDIFEALDE